MKRGVAIVLAVSLGCIIAFWLFGLSFTRDTSAFSYDSIIPLLLGFTGCSTMVFVSPSAVKSIAIGVIAPSLVIFGLFFTALLMEGTVEWGHLIIISKVIFAVILGLIIALFLRKMLDNNKNTPV